MCIRDSGGADHRRLVVIDPVADIFHAGGGEQVGRLQRLRQAGAEPADRPLAGELLHDVHGAADHASLIGRTMDIMQKFTGKRPVGWLGPGLTQTLETPDLLAAAGVKYIGDWVYDDEPTVIRTAKG